MIIDLPLQAMLLLQEFPPRCRARKMILAPRVGRPLRFETLFSLRFKPLHVLNVSQRRELHRAYLPDPSKKQT
jgi:hypothetical protein